MDNKQYDWVLANLLNPTMSSLDFMANDINANNTTMFDRDKYLNSSTILKLPQFESNGAFDQSKFNTFFDSVEKSYLGLANDTYAEDTIKKASSSYNNLWVTPDRRDKEVEFNVTTIYNPNRLKMGMEDLGFISNPTKSPQEIAQENLVWDDKSLTWEESPNDSWLTRNWFEPVAMATWDFDADANGNPTSNPDEVFYKKGLYKINPETGTYYYEKLNGKSPYGKQVLSPFDVITTDGSKANQYDFFDSDGLDKSFIGSVMKTTARIAPMFVPYVGPVYIALDIASELAKTLPIIYKSTFGLGSEDHSIANTIEAVAQSFSANLISQKGSESFFNSEQILNLIGDTAKQLYEQRWLFTKAPKMFKKYGIEKNIMSKDGKMVSELDQAIEEKALGYMADADRIADVLKSLEIGEGVSALANTQQAAFAEAALWGEKYQEEFLQIGRQISKLYMTGTSSYQAYQDAKSEGASDMEAAAVFWGYFAGEYAIMSTELGEHVLPELRADKLEIKNVLSTVAKDAGAVSEKEAIAAGSTAARAANASKFKQIFTAAGNLAKDTFNKGLHPVTLGAQSLFANALGEGIEEVSEEVLYDVTRATFNTLSQLSGNDTHLEVFNNWEQRYAQSFFGGFLGGAMFEGINDIQNRKMFSPDVESANQQLIYYVRNGRTAQIKDTLKKMRDQHLFGNPNLSTQWDKVEDGTIVYKPGTIDDNQNEAIYRLMINYVDNIASVLDKENMIIPDQRIVNGGTLNTKDVLQQIRYQYLLDTAGSPTTGGMLQDWNNMANRFLELHHELETLDGATDLEKRSADWQASVAETNRQLDELRKLRENFFTPEVLLNYIAKMIWSANSALNQPFINLTLRDFVQSNFHKNYEDLTDYEKKVAKERYSSYLALEADLRINAAHEIFAQLNKKYSAKLAALGEEGYKKYNDARNALLSIRFELEHADGTKSLASILDLLSELYGKGEMDADLLTLLAERLHTLENPFNEIRQIFIKQGSKVENTLTAQTKINTLNTLLAALLKISQDHYVDSSLSETIKGIVDTLMEIPSVTFEDAFNIYSDAENNDIIPQDDDFYKILIDFANTTTLDKYASDFNDFKDKLLAKAAEIDAAQGNTLATDIANQIISSVLNSLNAYDLTHLGMIPTYNSISTILNSAILNPIQAILKEFNITTTSPNTMSVLDIIAKTEDIFKKKEVRQFVVDGDISIEDVLNARMALRQLEAVIRASLVDNINASNPFGYNASLNLIAKKAGLPTDLGEIDAETAALMIQDLATYDKKLAFVEELHFLNKESTIRELARVGINIEYLSFDIIGKEDCPLYKTLDASGLPKDREITGLVNGLTTTVKFMNSAILAAINNATTISLLINDQNRTVDISDENTKVKIRQERLAIEKAVYDRVQELCQKFGRKTVLSLLMSDLLDFSKISVKNDGIYSNTPVFSDSDAFAYLTTVFGLDPMLFEYVYNETIKNDSSSLAPLPTLKLSIKTAVTAVLNPDFVDDMIEATGINDGAKIILKHTVFLSGIPGAGKTTACGHYTIEILKRLNSNLTTWTVGPRDVQAVNAAENILLDDSQNQVMDKQKILEILGTDELTINSSDAVVIEKYLVTNPLRKLKLIANGGNSSAESVRVTLKNIGNARYNVSQVPNVIIIDEATHFTAAELMKIADFAAKNNSTVLLMGDPDQSGHVGWWDDPSLGRFKNAFIYSCYCLSAPKLTISMRVTNTNKRDNLSEARRVDSEYTYADKLLAGVTTIDLWNELVNKMKLKYTESDKGVYGDKLMDASSVTVDTFRELLAKLEDGEKLGFICDDTNSPIFAIYQSLTLEEKDKIDRHTSESVQGSENLFFVIDTNWGAKKITTGNDADDFENYLSFVRALYTALTRSKLGSIIIDNGLSGIIAADTFEEIPPEAVLIVQDFKNDTSLLNYKETEIRIMDLVLAGYNPQIIQQIPTTPQINPQLLLQQQLQQQTGGNNAPTITPLGQNGFLEIHASNLNTAAIDFNSNIVIIEKGGKLDKARTTIQTKSGYIYMGNSRIPNEVTSKADLDQFIADNIDGLDKTVILITIPKAEYNSSGATDVLDFLEKQRSSKRVPLKYINYIIYGDKKAPVIPPVTSGGGPNTGGGGGSLTPLTVGTYRKYGSEIYKILGYDNNTSEYTLLNVSNPLGGAIKVKHTDLVTNSIEVSAPTATNEPGSTPEGTAIVNEITLDENGEVSDLEVSNILDYVQNNETGLIIYTSLGFRQGVALKLDAEGNPEVITKKDNLNRDVLYVTIIKAGHKNDTNPMDLLAILGISNNTQPVEIEYNTFQDAIQLLAEIRSLIRYTNAENNQQTYLQNLSDQIIELVNDFRNDHGLTPLNLLNSDSNFLIKINPNPDLDTDKLIGIGSSDIPNKKSLIFTIKGASGSSDFEITLGTVLGVKAQANYIERFCRSAKATGRITLALADTIIAHFNKVSSILDAIYKRADSKKYVNPTYITLPNYSMGAKTLMTNIRVVKVANDGRLYYANADDGSKEHSRRVMSFMDFKQNSTLIVSDPHILTGVKLQQSLIDMSMAGRAIAFVSDDLDLEYKGLLVANNPNLLADMWMNGTDEEKSKVKIISLNPRGRSLEEYILSVCDNKNSLSSGGLVIYPLGNINTSSKILKALTIIDAELTRFILNNGLPTENFSINGSTSISFNDINEAILYKNTLDLIISRSLSTLENWLEIKDNFTNFVEGKDSTKENVVNTRATELLNLFADPAQLESAFNAILNITSNEDSWSEESQYFEAARENTFNIATILMHCFAEKVEGSGWEINNDSPLKAISWLLANYHKEGSDVNFTLGIFFNPTYKKAQNGNGIRIAEEMCYPAENVDGDFLVNNDMQSANYIIKGDDLNDIIKALFTAQEQASLGKTIRSKSVAKTKTPEVAKAKKPTTKKQIKTLKTTQTPEQTLEIKDVHLYNKGDILTLTFGDGTKQDFRVFGVFEAKFPSVFEGHKVKKGTLCYYLDPITNSSSNEDNFRRMAVPVTIVDFDLDKFTPKTKKTRGKTKTTTPTATSTPGKKKTKKTSTEESPISKITITDLDKEDRLQELLEAFVDFVTDYYTETAKLILERWDNEYLTLLSDKVDNDANAAEQANKPINKIAIRMSSMHKLLCLMTRLAVVLSKGNTEAVLVNYKTKNGDETVSKVGTLIEYILDKYKDETEVSIIPTNLKCLYAENGIYKFSFEMSGTLFTFELPTDTYNEDPKFITSNYIPPTPITNSVVSESFKQNALAISDVLNNLDASLKEVILPFIDAINSSLEKIKSGQLIDKLLLIEERKNIYQLISFISMFVPDIEKLLVASINVAQGYDIQNLTCSINFMLGFVEHFVAPF